MSNLSSSVGSNNQLLTNDTDVAVVDGIIQFRENAGPRPSILSVHGTAISHASSTPMVGHQANQMQELVCSNLSSIFITPQPPLRRSNRTSLKSIRDENEEVVSSSTDRCGSNKNYASDYSDDDSEETPHKRQKGNKYTCKDWQILKPKNEYSLYYIVVNQPNNLDEHVWNWTQLYREDQKAANYRLIQFFFDICGFESIDVSTKYNMDYNFENMKLTILRNIPMIQKVTPKYLFKSTTGWAVEKQKHVYDFIEKLMIALSRTDIFFYFDFLKHFLYLFVSFISVDLKSTVSTCGFVVTKMYTVAKKFQANIESDLEKLSLSPDDRETLETKKNIASRFVTALLGILNTALSKNDSSLKEMFVAVMDEIKIWLKMNLSVIASDLKTYLSLISKVICNKTGKLRKAAITTCKEFVKFNLKEVLDESSLKNFIEIIGGRVCDINNEVAVVAIDVHTEIIRRDSTFEIPVLNKVKFVVLLYDTSYLLAISAGRYYAEIISLGRDKNCGTLSIIRHIIQMHREVAKYQKTMAFLVESLLPNLLEFKDWDFMVDLLLRNDALEYDEEIVLVELLCESIKQVLTGKGPRRSSFKGKIDEDEVYKALDIFLRGFPRLQRKYGTNLNCLCQFYGVLAEINFKDITFNRFRDHIQDVLGEAKLLFFRCNDEILLKYISQYFYLLTDYLSPSCDQSLGVIISITELVIQKCNNHLEHVDENEIVNEDDMCIMEQSFLKLQMLYYYHDLSDSMNFSFMLDKAVKLEENVTPKARAYIFKCCLLHLCHKWKKVIDSKYTEELNNFIIELKVNLEKYIESCFIVLNSTKIRSLKYTIFQYVCEVYLYFNQSVYSILDDKPHMSGMILEPIQAPCFMIVAQEYFFGNEDDFKLDERRNHFFNILQMFFCNGLPILEYVKLYQYFYTHYLEYGDLIKKHIMLLSEENIVSAVMILHTIKYCYNNISQEDSDACRNLQQLSCQFQEFLCDRPTEINLLLKLGLKFVVSHVEHYFMFNFIKPFFGSVSRKTRNDMANYILSEVAEEHKSNQHIVDSIAFLRARKCNLDYSFAAVVNNSTDSGSTHSGSSYRIESFSDDQPLVVNQ